MGPSVKHGKPKKQKLEGKGGHGTGPGPGRPKSKNLQPKIPEYEFQDDPIEVPRIPKNDAPNRCPKPGSPLPSPHGGGEAPRVSPQVPSPPCPLRPRRFWASVEPYCADLTNEEVRVLEELLKPPEDEAEHYKVRSSRSPSLPHSSLTHSPAPSPRSSPWPGLARHPRSPSSSSPPPQPPSPVAGGAASPVLSVPPPPVPADPAPGEALLAALGPGGPAGGAEGRSPGCSRCRQEERRPGAAHRAGHQRCLHPRLAQRAGGCGERFGGLAPNLCRARAASAPLLIIFPPPSRCRCPAEEVGGAARAARGRVSLRAPDAAPAAGPGGGEGAGGCGGPTGLRLGQL